MWKTCYSYPGTIYSYHGGLNETEAKPNFSSKFSISTFNPLSANPFNPFKYCLSVFDHFVKLALKGLMNSIYLPNDF